MDKLQPYPVAPSEHQFLFSQENSISVEFSDLVKLLEICYNDSPVLYASEYTEHLLIFGALSFRLSSSGYKV